MTRLLLWCWLFWGGVVVAAEPMKIPALTQPVMDMAQVLSGAEQKRLQRLLLWLQQQTQVEMVVLTVNSTQEEAIAPFAARVFEQWALGSSKRDDGVLLVVAIADRTVRIEVGYGLEGELTDVQVSRLLRAAVTPELARADYFLGLSHGVIGVARLLGLDVVELPSQGVAALPRADEAMTERFDDGIEVGALGFWLWLAGMIWLPRMVFKRRNVLLRSLQSALVLVFGALLWDGLGQGQLLPVAYYLNVLVCSGFVLCFWLLLWGSIKSGGDGGHGVGDYASGSGGSSSDDGGGSSGGGGASDDW